MEAVVVKGMRKPEHCVTCKFDRFYECMITHDSVPVEEGRLDNCPLIELSDGLWQVQGEEIWKY